MGGGRVLPRSASALVLAVLFMAASLPVQGAAPPLAPPIHPSITIERDADFMAPLSGVSGGSGTAEDPYVISGLTILRHQRHGILLRDTDAHVVIEDVRVTGPETALGVGLASCTAELAECELLAGIALENASNVTIRRTAVLRTDVQSPFLLHAIGARHVVVEDIGPALGADADLTRRLLVERSENVTIRRIVISSIAETIETYSTTRFTLENSTIRGDPFAYVLIEEGRDITIRDTDFVRTTIVTAGEDMERVRLERNTLIDSEFYGGGRQDAPLVSFLACGNDVDGFGATISLFDVSGATVLGNRFAGAFSYADADNVEGLRYERNTHTGGSYGPLLDAPGAAVHENALDADAHLVSLRPADVTRNWWGTPDGPSGIGPGSGAELEAHNATPFHPWLAAPPDTSVDCALEILPPSAGFEPARVETFRLPGGVAWRARIQAEGTDTVRLLAYSEPVGEELLSLRVDYDPAAPEAGLWTRTFASFRTGSVQLGGGPLSNLVDPDTLNGGWRAWQGLDCTGARCPHSAIGMISGPGGAAFTEFTIFLRGNASIELLTAPIHMGSSDRFESTELTLAADGLRAAAAVNRGSQEAFEITSTLWGASFQRAPDIGEARFEMEHPDGTRAEASDAILLALDPGRYAFHMDQTGVGDGHAAGYYVAADLPP